MQKKVCNGQEIPSSAAEKILKWVALKLNAKQNLWLLIEINLWNKSSWAIYLEDVIWSNNLSGDNLHSQNYKHANGLS